MHFDCNRCWCLGPEPCHLASIHFLWGKQQAHWHSITLFWHSDLLPPPVTWTTHNAVHDKCCVNHTTAATHTHRRQVNLPLRPWPATEMITSTSVNKAEHAFPLFLPYFNSISPEPPAGRCCAAQIPTCYCRSAIESKLIAAITGFFKGTVACR